MNFGKLITPIGVHLKNKTHQTLEIDDTDATEDKHQPITVPHSLQYHERSYFKDTNSEVEPSRQEEVSGGKNRKAEKLESIDHQLQDIEKRKNQFQMKNKKQSQNSIEKLANRSIERHHLKPSGAPKVNNTTQFSLSDHFRAEEPSFQHLQQPSLKDKEPEVIIVDHQSLFEPQDSWMQPLQLSQKDTLQPGPSLACKGCECEQTFMAFMREARSKMEELSWKLSQMQEDNKKYRESSQKEEEQKILKNIQNVTKNKQFPFSPYDSKADPKSKQCTSSQKQSKENRKPASTSFFSQTKKQPQNQNNLKKQPSNPKVQTLLHRLQLRISKS